MLKNLNNLQIAVLCDDDSDDNVKWDEDCEPARIRARLITNWEPRRLSGLDFGSETARQRFEVSTPIQHAGERPINPLSPEWIATFVLASIRAMTGGLWSIPADDLQQLYVWLDAEYEDGDDEDSAIVPLESEVTRLAGVIAQARAHIGEWMEWAQGIALDDERRISLPGPPPTAENPPADD